MRESGLEQTIVVCGCGPSLLDLPNPTRYTTIGVNDVGRLFDPTYLVVVNPRSQFKADRFQYVEQSKAKALHTQLELGPVRPPVRRFRLGQYGGTDLHDSSVLPYTQNSPYVAVCLAATLGAQRIGLIGVDFTDDHFFAATGPHALAKQLGVIDAQYGRLAAALAQRGIELVNLSARSRLTSLRKVDLSWLDGAEPRPAAAQPGSSGLRIVSYATTPVAGVPEILARCIDAATEHSAQCVWAGGSYGNGVAFAGGISWGHQPREALALLEAADVVIVHNGKVDPAHARLLHDKPIVTMAHNYGWNVDMQHVRRGMPGVVVGQYQATLPEFAGWQVVPNPLPLWEYEQSQGLKGERITIAYTPSGRHERYPTGHRLYWHGKGYDTTMRVLDRLAQSTSVQLETTAGGQVTHERALQMKQRAHIVIDECVTGSYHRNSLEGLAAGAVVINGLGLLDGVDQAFRHCAPEAGALPFVCCELPALEGVLLGLLEQGPAALAALGQANRKWMEQHWQFVNQWPRHWWPAMERALASRNGGRQSPLPPQRTPPNTSRERVDAPVPATVSVVIPHAGIDRLPYLAATLRSLAVSSVAAEVLVVESGVEPVAAPLCAAQAVRHLFFRDGGPFQRGRLLNIGTLHAQHEWVLWQDNDLLFAADFISDAVAEMQQRGLDAFLPYFAIRYLAPEDTYKVMSGELPPAQARAEKTLRAAMDVSGGLCLVRRSFVDREGGVPEGFVGWGGEDNAWVHKASLLGRFGATGRSQQLVHHLFHGQVGAHAGTPQRHAHYAENVALLARQRAVRSADRYRECFPTPHPEGAIEIKPAKEENEMHEPIRNVFACLVHESVECVIDLVRNLRHFDAASRIVLYDGSQGGRLLDKRLPWAEWGVTVHPSPHPMTWGRLHGFALDCLRLLREGESYDTITIVDSDQLLLRAGYSEFLAAHLANRKDLGVLSNRPEIQGAATAIAPARTALQERAHWQDWLDTFEGGQQHWVHWSFWPGTVITREAGEAILKRVDQDVQFNLLLASSKMWATEEVLFPTLAALLGFRVERNPCSDRFVQFRKSHDRHALDLARALPEAFWMHPVPRNYGDPTRCAIRTLAHQYRPLAPAPAPALAPAPAPSHPRANPWLPLLRTMQTIDGWLADDEAELLALAAMDVLAQGHDARHLVEIGSYCGKATFILAHAARLSSRGAPRARVIAIDTFDGTVGALDTTIERKGDTRARFDATLRQHGLSEWVDARRGRASEVAIVEDVSLLLVDGLHDHASAALDFHAVRDALTPDALVLFHDRAPYFPGVCSLVDELIQGGQWRERWRTGSLCALERVEAVSLKAPVRNSEVLEEMS